MTEENFERLIQKTGDYTSPIDAKTALDSVVNSLMQSMVKNEDVTLDGFGTLMVSVVDGPIKGPTIVPGDIKREFYKSPYLIKIVKIKFDKVLKHKINDLENDNRAVL